MLVDVGAAVMTAVCGAGQPMPILSAAALGIFALDDVAVKLIRCC
jgi:hypothetical protein